jgi:hypothetical protein
MNIRQYLIDIKAPLEMSRFADFSVQLKNKFRTLDGYAFNYDKYDVRSVKFYYKIYTKSNNFDANFFNWYFNNDMFYYAFKGYFNSKSLDLSGGTLTGINFSIKYDTLSKKMVRSIYFQCSRNSCLVIHNNAVNTWISKYYYMHNRLLIHSINKIFKLNMPKHRESIEISTRGTELHASIFPRFDRASLTLDESKSYCAKLMPNLISDNSLPAQNIPLAIHCYDDNSSFITKGYTSNNTMQKIYFGCFDWQKSIFKN